jgi:lysophospholipase L1-like esterase
MRTTVLPAVAFATAVSLCACASAPVAAPPAGSPSPAASPPASSLAPAAPATSPSASSSARGLVVFDGCSLVMDTGLDEAGMMPAQTMALLPAGLEGVNLGVPGQTTGMMQADAEDQVDPLAAGRRRPVLVVWEGTNDLVYGTDPPLDASAAYRHLAAYCRARQRAGYSVVVLTVLPREGSAEFEAARGALNARLRDGWRGFADRLADVAADPAIGDAGAEFDQTYYRDTVHLTPAGYGVVARRVAAEVRTLL